MKASTAGSVFWTFFCESERTLKACFEDSGRTVIAGGAILTLAFIVGLPPNALGKGAFDRVGDSSKMEDVVANCGVVLPAVEGKAAFSCVLERSSMGTGPGACCVGA